MGADTRPRHPLLVAWVVTIVVTALSVGAYFLPFTEQALQEGARHIRMSLTVAMAASMCGAAVLFLRGTALFKVELRKAYRWFAAGLILFSVSLLQWPASVVFGLSQDSWATSGAIIVPFIFATASMYAGMRLFSKLLGVPTLLRSRWTLALFAVGLAAASGGAAHVWSAHDAPGLATDSYTAMVAWTLTFGVGAWMLVLRIRRAIGPEYYRLMNWLAVALGALNFSGAHEYVTSYFLDESDPYIHLGLSLIPFVVAGALFLVAGYLFSAGPKRAGAAIPANPANDAQAYLDSIAAIAQLASRPADIDVMLDDLRQITAALEPGVPLSEDQRSRLARLYLRLEAYLTTNDPLRTFDKDELREDIAPGLRERVAQEELPPVGAP